MFVSPDGLRRSCQEVSVGCRDASGAPSSRYLIRVNLAVKYNVVLQHGVHFHEKTLMSTDEEDYR